MPTMTPVTFDGCFGWLHRPRGARATMGVVLCNPFGYEALSAYRGWRDLADALAARGVAALRFDYPGTGDSSGNEEDPLRWRAWLDSIKSAVGVLREQSGVSHITLCGLRLGATLAAIAAEELGGVDNLVLLMPLVSGKAYIRELELQQHTWLAAQRALGLELGEEPPGTVGAHGFRLYPDTLALLSKVDLTGADAGRATHGEARLARRVLLHDISDSARLQRLAAHYQALGVPVQVQLFGEYGRFLLNPSYSESPRRAFDSVLEWLDGGASALSLGPMSFSAQNAPNVRHAPNALNASNAQNTRNAENAQNAQNAPHPPNAHNAQVDVTPPAPSVNIAFADGRERPVVFSGYVGVLCEPRHPLHGAPAVLFVNTGGVHRIGDSRFTVLMARRLAAQGIASLRMDLSGLGDSVRRGAALTLDTVYSQYSIDDACAGVDWLTAAGYPTIVMAGVCSGAYVSLHAALARAAVTGCVCINLPFFRWGGARVRPGAQYVAPSGVYRRAMRNPRKWLRLLTGQANARAISLELARRLSARFAARAGAVLEGLLGERMPGGAIRRLAFELERKGVQTALLYGTLDEGLDELDIHFGPDGNRLRERGNILVKQIARVDHALFSRCAREAMMAHFERFLRERVLGAHSDSASVSAPASASASASASRSLRTAKPGSQARRQPRVQRP
ncbi:serine aminopeptidase domain-containing protein [Burkholderia sp. WSM2232]|uniref:serine aminopeptidase domain-containing protein n=1 Tax=Burkholderia sp. WSM2232 TaxID=944436 RepID=UPI0004883F04|nr:alpha/beta fold hydrolase [Burkholderia sp. WSM2232]